MRDAPLRRVLLFTNWLTYGGAETQTVTLALGLAERGYQVHLFSIRPSEAHADTIAAAGIGITYARLGGRMPDMVSTIRDAAIATWRWRPDALVSFVFQSNLVARVAGRICRAPVIVSSIRNENFGGRRRERLIRATDGLATLTTTNSTRVATAMVERGVVPDGRMRVVRNAVDTDVHRPGTSPERQESRTRLDVSDQVFCWLAVGRLAEQKAWPVLLTALARLGPDHVVRIVGAGPLDHELRRTAADLGVAERVRWMGWRGDVDVLMRGADGLVLSSNHEGLPNVVAEAMASGLPVVATDVGGVRELMDHGTTGVVCPPQDPVRLAEAMDKIATASPGVRTSMGAAGRQKMVESFAVERIVDDWEGLLIELMAAAPKRRRSSRP